MHHIHKQLAKTLYGLLVHQSTQNIKEKSDSAKAYSYRSLG